MRRFLIYSLLALLPLAHVKACISEGHLHNSYMFSVFHRNALTYGPPIYTPSTAIGKAILATTAQVVLHTTSGTERR